MRTSNKILLTVFLSAIGILTGIHIALYAKYKSGDFIVAKDLWKQEYTRHELKPVKYIVATGLDNLVLIPSDTAQLEIRKEGGSRIRFQVDGDTLILRGDTTIRRPDGSLSTERSWTNVNVYLPVFDAIRADNCSLNLHGATDSSRAGSLRIGLINGSAFHLEENDWGDSTSRFFNRLDIQAGPSSEVELAKYAVIGSVTLSLEHAAFDDKEASLDSLTIQADGTSSLEIRGKNFQHITRRIP